MKILTLWLWSFWFAINKLLAENNPKNNFYFYWRNKDLVSSIKKTREHPDFFKWYKLPENIEVINNYDDIISDVDLLILAIPAQNIWFVIEQIVDKLKPGIKILNLAKWIDIKNNQTIFWLLNNIFLSKDFDYAILSWWMLAIDVVKSQNIWADLWVSDLKLWNEIKSLLSNKNFDIKISQNILNIELYWCFKNIMAIIIWYYEELWEWKSSIWKYFVDYLNECKQIISIYWWTDDLDFCYYSLGWDMIASCFGNSRNRYLWKLLWQGKKIDEALDILNRENKHSEWYETIKAVYEKIKYEDGFEITKMFYKIMY